jgi:thymidine phosphorylase
VKAGEPLCIVHAANEATAAAAVARLQSAYTIQPAPAAGLAIVLDRIAEE